MSRQPVSPAALTRVSQVTAELAIALQGAGLAKAQATAEAQRIRDLYRKAFRQEGGLVTGSVYVALCDLAEGSQSSLIGALSTEEEARNACQEAENDDADEDAPPLEWNTLSGTARASDGDSYDIVLVDMDMPNGS
jgi:hypothetical protein